MISFRLILIINVMCINMLHSQINHKFKLDVKSSYTNFGTLQLAEAYYLPNYRAALFKIDSALYFDGMYQFENKILYPTAFRIFNLKGFNKLLFLDTGYNQAEIVVKDSIPNIKVKSKIEQEHLFFLEQMGVNSIDEQISMQRFQYYVSEHPKSYVALFVLIEQMFNYRFSPEMKCIADNFDTIIKSTKTFSYFKKQYLDRRKFIPMDVINENGKKVNLTFNPEKYTLLDFWWVGCKPCYVDMKKINQKIRKLGTKLEVISINTDSREQFKESKERFINQQLSWKSFWDYEGLMSNKNISFYKYPTNLLIDRDGYIIATDVNIERLEDFIKD